MRALRSRYTDQVSTLMFTAFAEIYNVKTGIVKILCGKAIFDRSSTFEVSALFAGGFNIAVQ